MKQDFQETQALLALKVTPDLKDPPLNVSKLCSGILVCIHKDLSCRSPSTFHRLILFFLVLGGRSSSVDVHLCSTPHLEENAAIIKLLLNSSYLADLISNYFDLTTLTIDFEPSNNYVRHVMLCVITQRPMETWQEDAQASAFASAMFTPIAPSPRPGAYCACAAVDDDDSSPTYSRTDSPVHILDEDDE